MTYKHEGHDNIPLKSDKLEFSKRGNEASLFDSNNKIGNGIERFLVSTRKHNLG